MDRLLQGERIQRPTSRERAAGEWDWYNALSVSDRRWVGRYLMADAGARPEDIQHWNRFETVDAAMSAVLTAARVELRRSARKTAQFTADEVSDWEESVRADERRAALELYGPQELAAILGVTIQAVHQRQHRGRLPAPDLVVSRVPMWHGETLRAHNLMGE